MSPPPDARDPVEGYCEPCSDWAGWHALEACPGCGEHLCASHRRPGQHRCKGAEPMRDPERRRENNRRHKLSLHERGLCTGCAREPVLPERWRCAKCVAASTERKRRARAKLPPKPPRPPRGLARDSAEYAERERERNRRRYRERVGLPLDTPPLLRGRRGNNYEPPGQCRRCSAPHLPGETLCASHLQTMAELEAERRGRR